MTVEIEYSLVRLVSGQWVEEGVYFDKEDEALAELKWYRGMYSSEKWNIMKQGYKRVR